MIKNNLIALFGHIAILLIFFIILFPIGIIIDPNGDSSRMTPYFSLVSVICWFLYIFWGYAVMETQGSKLKDLLSVSILGILGLIFTVIDFCKLFSQSFTGISFLCSITTSSIFFIGLSSIDRFKGSSFILFFAFPIFNFIPSLLLWTGMEYRKKKELRKV